MVNLLSSSYDIHSFFLSDYLQLSTENVVQFTRLCFTDETFFFFIKMIRNFAGVSSFETHSQRCNDCKWNWKSSRTIFLVTLSTFPRICYTGLLNQTDNDDQNTLNSINYLYKPVSFLFCWIIVKINRPSGGRYTRQFGIQGTSLKEQWDVLHGKFVILFFQWS